MRIRRRLWFSFSAALALSLLFIGSGTAASASSKRIAFVDSAGALWTALPNGTGLTNLGGSGRMHPSISTDGGTIYFDAGGAIQSIPSGGGSATTVCAPPGLSDPALSPSGAQLAYESGGSIAVGPSTGCGSVVAGGSDPAWSPDSRQLAFVAGGDVFVAQADGSAATNLTSSGAAESDPAWSPSGADIAYIADGELLVMGADGSNKRLLTSNTNDESNPTWSADAAEILFARAEGAATRLYAIQLSDSSTRLITDGSQPDWGLAVANTAPPTITIPSGATYSEGVELSANNGSWVSINSRSFSYRWQRCGSSSCSDISGATGGTYTLAAEDVGNTVRVVVIATTSDGSAPGTSATTPVVAAAAPRNIIPPTIEGDFVIGETLTAENGTWVGTNVVFTYQWQRCEPSGGACTDIPGATAKIFAPASADVGKTLKVVVTGTNSLGTGTGTSNASPAVASNVPANTTLPTIAEVVGTTGAITSYRADEGEWTGVEPMTTKFQWRRCDSSGGNCTDIAGASFTTYTPIGADIGSRLRVAVTQTNVFGSATAVSNATAVLAGTPPANTSRPFVTGTERVGSVLSASVGTWTGSLPLTYTYQWQRCNTSGAACSNIASATSASYIPTTGDQGATLVVSVTARNASGSATIASLATDAIEAASTTTTTTSTRPTNSRVPAITGVLARGRVLTAGNGTWTGTTPMTFAYQWQRCPRTGTTCTAIVGATRNTYTLAAADVGRRIRLSVTAANVAGPTAAQSSITGVVAATAPTAIRQVNGNARANRLTGTARAERIDGKGGNDRIDGKGGKDVLIGGTGNDTILAADGIAETINCGPGRDRVTADRTDKLSGCERVTRRPARRR